MPCRLSGFHRCRSWCSSGVESSDRYRTGAAIDIGSHVLSTRQSPRPTGNPLVQGLFPRNPGSHSLVGYMPGNSSQLFVAVDSNFFIARRIILVLMNSYFAMRIAFAALGFSACTFSLAQAPAELRYPWDARPAKCFDTPKPLNADCISEDWPTYGETKAKIVLLYKTEQFTLLDRALTEIAALDRRNKYGWRFAKAIQDAFIELTPSKVANYRPDEPLRLARWRLANPQSKYLPLLEAQQIRARAWNIRGNGYADTVSAQSWDLFRKSNREAENLLLTMPAEQRDTINWYHTLLGISSDLEEPSRSTTEIFEEGVAKWPDYYPFYNFTAYRLMPKWGGSWRQVESFADKWTKKNIDKDGGALYARIYTYLSDQASFQEMQPDWIKLKRGFESLIKAYPVDDFRNHFASFACAARDKATFISIMRDLPQEKVIATNWIQGHTYAACVEWAYAKS